LQQLLSKRGLTNVRLEYRPLTGPTGSYWELPGRLESSFDFISIDGKFRPECARASLALVKSSGHTYVDNTDFGTQWDPYARAEAIVRQAAIATDATVTYFTGFAPALFVANQGMLVDWSGTSPATVGNLYGS